MKEDMLTTMKKELFLRKDELENKKLASLYFGGGTPSILSISEIENLLHETLKYFSFDENIEITLEANPDDLDKNFLRELSKTPINRLSIGTQSFFEEDLKLMNRAHTAYEAEKSIKQAQDFGFENISIDLIYGAPTSNLEIWKKNLDKVINLNVPHISSYALTIEPKTALDNWIAKGKINSPSENQQNKEFYYMTQFLKENGFEHYEISNFAKPNFYSRHNSSYWEYLPYLGIGPSAHSYNGKDQRSWNIANNAKYIKSLSENHLPHEIENLSVENQYNEFLMIGLRTSKGVDIDKITAKFPKEIVRTFLKDIQPKIEDKTLLIENNRLKISKDKWFLADGIASDLFLI